MATPTRLSVRISSTVNLGDYNNIKFDFGIDEDVPEGTTRALHFDRLFNWVWTRVEENVTEAKKAARG